MDSVLVASVVICEANRISPHEVIIA